VLQKSVGFGFQEDLSMALIFLRNEFFKCFLGFAFTGFHSKFSEQSVTSTDPDFIRGVCNNTGFDPGLVFRAIGFEDIGRE
jgi:hypothetical protein